MTTTATYLTGPGETISRVRVAFSAAPAGSDYALIERSTDLITWVTVRGGATVQLVAGAGKIDDYEFEAGVLNTYRVSFVDASVTFVAAGTVATGNNTSITPAHPAGLAVGDTKLTWVSIRNSGAGAPVVPAGWTKIVDAGNAILIGKKHVGGDVAPLITFTGGVANADTIGQMAAWRNMTLSPTPSGVATFNNPIAQDIFVPNIPIVSRGAILFLGWKQDDWTSVATPTFGAKVGDGTSTAGDDSGNTWTWFATVGPPTTPMWGAQTMLVTGGATAISKGATVAFATEPYVTQDTATVTPVPISVYIKNPSRPSQNFAATVTDPLGDTVRPGRSATIDVVGRTLPVAITDLQGSREITLTITVDNLDDAAAIDDRLATGEVLFIQAPGPGCVVPTMYAVLGSTRMYRKSKRGTRRYFELPLKECAAPGPTITGDTITWADVIAQYATWADVIAANPTWGDLIDSRSTGTVIVP